MQSQSQTSASFNRADLFRASFPSEHNMPADQMIEALASLLSEMCIRNDQARAFLQYPVTRFHSVSPPSISIRNYLLRIRRFAACSDSCFITALMYLDRAQSLSGVPVDSLNVHRLLIAAIMISAKFFDDRVQRNCAYAHIGGVSCIEMNGLEVELLNVLGFNLDISTEGFQLYENALIHRYCKECAPRIVSPIAPCPARVTASPDSCSHSDSALHRITSASSSTVSRSPYSTVSDGSFASEFSSPGSQSQPMHSNSAPLPTITASPTAIPSSTHSDSASMDLDRPQSDTFSEWVVTKVADPNATAGNSASSVQTSSKAHKSHSSPDYQTSQPCSTSTAQSYSQLRVGLNPNLAY